MDTGTANRQAGLTLPCSPAEVHKLVASCGDAVTRLAGRWSDMLADLTAIGPLVAITRNPHAVLEQRGPYPLPARPAESDLALRLELARWHAGFALHLGPAPRVQFFDRFGVFVHAVALEPGGDVAAFDRFAERWAHEDQSRRQTFAEAETSPAAALMIGGLAGADHAMAVAGWSLGLVLEQAAAEGLPVSIEVESPGAVQAFRGRIAITRVLGPWINVLDPQIALHVRRDDLGDTLVVRRATWRGVEATLEVVGRDGRPVVRVGSAAAPGSPHDHLWQRLLEHLPIAGRVRS